MIVPEQAVPAAPMQLMLPLGEHFLKLRRIQRLKIPFLFAFLLIQKAVLELKDHRKLASVRVAELFCNVGSRSPRFAYCD